MKVSWINIRRGASHIVVNVTDDRMVEIEVSGQPPEKLTAEEAEQLSRALKAGGNIIAAVEEV